jgi:uncharacterized membrane protein YhhN
MIEFSAETPQMTANQSISPLRARLLAMLSAQPESPRRRRWRVIAGLGAASVAAGPGLPAHPGRSRADGHRGAADKGPVERPGGDTDGR